MSAKGDKILQVVSGWQAVELILKCVFVGIWQVVQIAVKKLWKGHRRKSKNCPPVELTVDASIGTHCYIKITGVKYHYVETGPKSERVVLILGDAPDSGNLWCPNWTNVVRRLAETGHHVITLDLRGTGGSEGGGRRELSPPRAVEELSALLEALGVSRNKPAVVIGFGIGGMLTWYLVHCHGGLVSKFAVIGAPHPNLYWQYAPAEFCHRVLHFIQWPFLPERWLADSEAQEEGRWTSSRARDWSGALNYVRGAAWWQVQPEHRVTPPALLVGAKDSAAQLVSSAAHCTATTLRLVSRPEPPDAGLQTVVLDFILGKEKEKSITDAPTRTLVGSMGRMFGGLAGKGRELTATSLAAWLPPVQA